MGIEIQARSEMAMQQQRQQRERAYAQANAARGVPAAAPTVAPSYPSVESPTFQSNGSAGMETDASKATGNKKKRKRPLADAQAHLLQSAAGDTNTNGTGASPFGTTASSGTAPATLSPEDQMKMNYFLLNELRKTKEEQIKMARELQVVKLENHKLNSRMVQAAEGYRLLQIAFRQMHPTYHLNPGAMKIPSTIEGFASASVSTDANLTQSSSSSAFSPNSSALTTASSSMGSTQDKAFAGWLSDKAMVVFDLSKNPAVVLTCNDAFCRLFGYQMDNVIGMAWKKFIDQAYFERTMLILQNNGASTRQTSSIQFMQVYKAPSGSNFVALDTHTFFYGTNGPRADLVTITPVQADLPQPTDQFFWPVSDAASPGGTFTPTSPAPQAAAAAAAAAHTAASTASATLSDADEVSFSVGGQPPPLRRRKVIETANTGPHFLKVQELTPSDEIAKSTHHGFTTADGAMKPKKPRQAKASGRAKMVGGTPEKPKRTAPARGKRAGALAGGEVNFGSPARFEEVSQDLYPPIIPHVADDLAPGAPVDPMLVDQSDLPLFAEDQYPSFGFVSDDMDGQVPTETFTDPFDDIFSHP